MYLKTDNNEKIYTLCIEEINTLEGVSLSDGLTSKKITLEEIYNKAKSKDSYWDGGSTIYYYDNFSILKCQTIDGSNDIIIGEKNLNINNGYCRK